MEDITIEKIDMVVERTGASYRDAKEALEKSKGNVVDALVYIESKNKSWGEDISHKGEVVLEKLKEAIRKGNVTRVLVKKNGEIIMNIPITAGAIGSFLAPPVALIGLTAAVASSCTIEIVKEGGEIVNINEMAERTVHKVKNTIKKD